MEVTGTLARTMLRLLCMPCVLCLLAVPIAVGARTGGADPAAETILPHTQFALDNGLTLIVREDRKLPIVSVEVIYQAGSRDDPPGKAGLAHLFEHLLFYGSQHHPHNFLTTMQTLGGINVNGGTGHDATTTYQTVPVSQLNAVLWLESERMGYLLPALNQKTLDEQIAIIRNEINMGRDEPGGEVRRHIAAGLFPPAHPYHEVPVGDPQQLGNITLDDARSFFRTHYAPSNAAVIIAGDITPADALAKVTEYFGGLPTGPRPNRVTAWIPELSHDRRERIVDSATPQLFLAWPMPAFGTADDIQLRLAGSILMDGDASRVRRRLSAAGLNASQLSWMADARAMAGVFQISTAATPAQFKTFERLIREEITALAAKAPTAAELDRAKRNRLLTLRRLAQRTADSDGQADLLAYSWLFGHGDAGLLDANLQQMRTVTAADVSAATRRWLDRAAYVLHLEPAVQYRATSADVDRTRLPEAAAFKPAAFPALHDAVLANGLKLRHARWHGGPLLVASLIVRGGAGVDPVQKSGLGKLTASLLSAGTATVSEIELADALARLDATLQATTDLDAVTLTVTAPAPRMKAALDLLAAIVATPAFPEAAVERAKNRQIEESQDALTTPRLLSRATVRRLLYGTGTPYAADGSGLGTRGTVSTISRADVTAYHARWFNPANSEIVVVGDIEAAEAQALLSGNFDRWSRSGSLAPAVSLPAHVAAPGVYVIDRPGMQQADLTLAARLDAPASRASPVNAVLTNVLGDSVAGRIYADLRDRRQWAYWASGSVEGGRDEQMLLIRTQVQIPRVAEAIAAIKAHIESINGSTPVSADELQRAKDRLTLSLPLAWETDEGIADAIATSVRHGLPDGAIENQVTDVRAVTTEQVAQAAREKLRADGMVWLIIGDQAQVEPLLKDAGIVPAVLRPEP